VSTLARSTSASSELDLSSAQAALVRAILREHLPMLEVRAFGSRVMGTAKRFSDLDLIVMSTTALPLRLWALVADAFAESNLPFKVDIVDASTAEPSFREHALARSVLVQAPQPLP